MHMKREIYSPGIKKKSEVYLEFWVDNFIVAFVYATFSLTLWALKISCYVLLSNKTLDYTNLLALRFPPTLQILTRNGLFFIL